MRSKVLALNCGFMLLLYFVLCIWVVFIQTAIEGPPHNNSSQRQVQLLMQQVAFMDLLLATSYLMLGC